MNTYFPLGEHYLRQKEIMRGRGWEKIFILVDLHDTVIRSDYTNDNRTVIYAPGAVNCLKVLTEREDVCLILWSSSNKEGLDYYEKELAKNNIKFDHVNCNPEVNNTDYADFTDKPYFNVIIDDKAGFNYNFDWRLLQSYLNEEVYLENKIDREKREQFKLNDKQKKWVQYLKDNPELQGDGYLYESKPDKMCCLGAMIRTTYNDNLTHNDVFHKHRSDSFSACFPSEEEAEEFNLFFREGFITHTIESFRHLVNLVNRLESEGVIDTYPTTTGLSTLAFLNDYGIPWKYIAEFIELFPYTVFKGLYPGTPYNEILG